MDISDPRELISLLGLVPLEIEGGWFREIYRSDESIAAEALPPRYGVRRDFATSIYYLVTADEFSTMHRIKSDEIFHLYLGGPVEMLILAPDGTGERRILGRGIANGERPQIVVPQGHWQGLRLRDGAPFALMGTTVAPGFAYEDFEHGYFEELAPRYPAFTATLEILARRRG